MFQGGRTIESVDLIGTVRQIASKHPEHPYAVALWQRTRLSLESKTQAHCAFACLPPPLFLLSKARAVTWLAEVTYWWIYLQVPFLFFAIQPPLCC